MEIGMDGYQIICLNMFKAFNRERFEGELPEPYITVTFANPKHKVAFKPTRLESINGHRYHLTIPSAVFDDGIEFVACEVAYNMVLMYAQEHGISCLSNDGLYHNRKFRDIAVEKGFQVGCSGKKYCGIYDRIVPDKKITSFCKRNGFSGMRNAEKHEIKQAVRQKNIRDDGKPLGSNSIKWVCPCCGTIIRSTRIVNVICGDCGKKFVMAKSPVKGAGK